MKFDPRGAGALLGLGRRAETGVRALIVVLLGTVAYGAVAAPRLLRAAESQSIAAAVQDAPPSARQLAIRVIDHFPRGNALDPLQRQRERLDDVTTGIDAAVLERFPDERFVADTSRFTVIAEAVSSDDGEPGGAAGVEPTGAAPALPTFLTFRVHPEIDEHSDIVVGRRAAATERVIGGMEVIEFELTPEAATELGWEVGHLVQLTIDPSDVVTRSFSGGLPEDFLAELVGLRELTDATDRYWFGDRRLHRPTVADTGLGANVYAYGTIHPEQLPSRPFLVDGWSSFALEQRRDLDDDAVTVDTVRATRDGLLQVEAVFSTQPTLSRPGVTTALRPVLDIEIGQRTAARSTLVLATAGVLGVMSTTLIQLLIGVAGRRRGRLTVARARGASRPQLVTAASFEMAGLATIGVVSGGLVAIATTPSAPFGMSAVLATVIWGGAVACAGGLAISEGMRPVNVSGRVSAHPGLGRWKRIGGWLLVIVALAAVVTFRRRGITTEVTATDPLVVSLPVLVPLAVVWFVRRLLPTIVARVARGGLSLGPGRLVGLRRIETSPDATVGVMTVLALALTVTALGVGVDRALNEGAVDASWNAVGAPYRIDTRSDDALAAASAVPGALVAAVGESRMNTDRDGDTYSAVITALDVAAARSITEGTAADRRLPTALDALRSDGSIPILTTTRINGRPMRVGDRLAGLGSRSGQVFHVVAVRSEVAGRADDAMLVDRAVLAQVAGRAPGFSSLLVDAPDAARAELERIAGAVGEELTMRDDVLAAQLDDPLSRAVRRGYLAAAGFALTLAVLALGAAAVVTARERRRDVAILGLLGAGRREITRAVIAELLPTIAAGVGIGTIVGWAVAASYDGRFDLSAFAAGTPVSVRTDPIALAVAAAILGMSAVAVVAAVVRRIVAANVTGILRADGAE